MGGMTFGDWLKRERTIRGLKQSDLESAAGLTMSYVSKVETGKFRLPREPIRQLIHAVLGTSDEDLVSVGILERHGDDSHPVYIPTQQEIPRDRVEPVRMLTPEQVIDRIAPIIGSMVWPPGMVTALEAHLWHMRDVQLGAVEEPRASWEDEE